MLSGISDLVRPDFRVFTDYTDVALWCASDNRIAELRSQSNDRIGLWWYDGARIKNAGPILLENVTATRIGVVTVVTDTTHVTVSAGHGLVTGDTVLAYDISGVADLVTTTITVSGNDITLDAAATGIGVGDVLYVNGSSEFTFGASGHLRPIANTTSYFDATGLFVSEGSVLGYLSGFDSDDAGTKRFAISALFDSSPTDSTANAYIGCGFYTDATAHWACGARSTATSTIWRNATTVGAIATPTVTTGVTNNDISGVDRWCFGHQNYNNGTAVTVTSQFGGSGLTDAIWVTDGDADAIGVGGSVAFCFIAKNGPTPGGSESVDATFRQVDCLHWIGA